jgi:hypothetical protein
LTSTASPPVQQCLERSPLRPLLQTTWRSTQSMITSW